MSEALKKALEQKAKTTNEILAYVHDAKGFIGIVPYMGETLVQYGQQKWVSLEDLKDFMVVSRKQLSDIGKRLHDDLVWNENDLPYNVEDAEDLKELVKELLEASNKETKK